MCPSMLISSLWNVVISQMFYEDYYLINSLKMFVHLTLVRSVMISLDRHMPSCSWSSPAIMDHDQSWTNSLGLHSVDDELPRNTKFLGTIKQLHGLVVYYKSMKTPVSAHFLMSMRLQLETGLSASSVECSAICKRYTIWLARGRESHWDLSMGGWKAVNSPCGSAKTTSHNITANSIQV